MAIWLTVMRIASIYPIVTKFSPENFGKTHIQYSDTQTRLKLQQMDGEAKKCCLPKICLVIFSHLCADLPEQLNFFPIEHFVKYDAFFQRQYCQSRIRILLTDCFLLETLSILFAYGSCLPGVSFQGTCSIFFVQSFSFQHFSAFFSSCHLADFLKSCSLKSDLTSPILRHINIIFWKT